MDNTSKHKLPLRSQEHRLQRRSQSRQNHMLRSVSPARSTIRPQVRVRFTYHKGSMTCRLAGLTSAQVDAISNIASNWTWPPVEHTVGGTWVETNGPYMFSVILSGGSWRELEAELGEWPEADWAEALAPALVERIQAARLKALEQAEAILQEQFGEIGEVRS